MIRVLLADDHHIVRAGLRKLLEAEGDMEVIGEARNGKEAVSLCGGMKPDVAVLDYAMPEMDGLDATREIAEVSPDTSVVILTMYDAEEYAVRLLRAGAAGFVRKTDAAEDLPAAIRRVASGNKYISGAMVAKLGPRLSEGADIDSLTTLSNRELQVLTGFGHGKSSREIAEQLQISMSSLQTYRRRIMTKLNLRNNAEMARFAVQRGLTQ